MTALFRSDHAADPVKGGWHGLQAMPGRIALDAAMSAKHGRQLVRVTAMPGDAPGDGPIKLHKRAEVSGLPPGHTLDNAMVRIATSFMLGSDFVMSQRRPGDPEWFCVCPMQCHGPTAYKANPLWACTLDNDPAGGAPLLSFHVVAGDQSKWQPGKSVTPMRVSHPVKVLPDVLYELVIYVNRNPDGIVVQVRAVGQPWTTLADYAGPIVQWRGSDAPLPGVDLKAGLYPGDSLPALGMWMGRTAVAFSGAEAMAAAWN